MVTATARFSCSDLSNLPHEVDTSFEALDEKVLSELVKNYAEQLNKAGWRILNYEWGVDNKTDIEET